MSKVKWRALGKKQTKNNDYWRTVYLNIDSIISKSYIDQLVEMTVSNVRKTTIGINTGYAWSGGKDSQALRGIIDLAGIDKCVMGMTNLEFPDFLRWVTDNMPVELEIVNSDLDLNWLVSNKEMLFPKESKIAAKWFKMIQHKAQEVFYKRHNLDCIVLGRRLADSNYTRASGENIYTSKGITRYSPLRNWSHEDVMAFCHYYHYPLPPIYTWPNGFVVGTGAWAARQWTKTIYQGWYETWLIDKDVVKEAAAYLPSAKFFLDKVRRNDVRPVRIYRYEDGFWVG